VVGTTALIVIKCSDSSGWTTHSPNNFSTIWYWNWDWVGPIYNEFVSILTAVNDLVGVPCNVTCVKLEPFETIFTFKREPKCDVLTVVRPARPHGGFIEVLDE